MTREEALNKTIGILTYHQVNFCKSKEAVANMNEIIEALEKIDQEHCADCISREATVERLCKLAEIMNEKREGLGSPYVMAALFIQDNKDEFPSVTPQQKMGHCKDCKYFEYDSVAKVDGIPLIVAHEICKRWSDGCKTSEDGYCFLFEPRESEE